MYNQQLSKCKNYFSIFVSELEGGYIASSGACAGDFGGPLYFKEKSAFVLTGEVIMILQNLRGTHFSPSCLGYKFSSNLIPLGFTKCALLYNLFLILPEIHRILFKFTLLIQSSSYTSLQWRRLSISIFDSHKHDNKETFLFFFLKKS